MLSSSSPAPVRSAAATDSAGISCETTIAISCTAAGIVQTGVTRVGFWKGSADSTTTNAQERSGKPSAAITLGCNSPA